MSANDTEIDQPISPSLPGPWAWVALAIILVLAAAGFLKGLGGARPIASILAPVKGLPAVAALTASDAAPMPHNDDWSVLSGPKILPPPPPKPAKVVSSDDDDPSDAAADQSAAADMDAQAPDDVPTPAPPPGDASPPPPTPPQ